MNITSIESLLSELDKVKAERDEAINYANNNELYIVNLTADRDRFANMISERSNRWQEMMAAKERERCAKELDRLGIRLQQSES